MPGFMYARVDQAIKHSRGVRKADAVFSALRNPAAEMREAGQAAIDRGASAKEVWQIMLAEGFGDDE